MKLSNLKKHDKTQIYGIDIWLKKNSINNKNKTNEKNKHNTLYKQQKR